MNCKNCSTKLSESTKYCPKCGAKVITERLTIKNILHNVSVQFFNYDNKILKTFIHLFTKPEVVIVGYIDGVRKRYINLLQYLAISLTITGLQFFILNTFFDNPFDFNANSFGIGSNVPNPKSVNSYMGTISEMMNNYYSLIYIFSIPFSAVGSWMTYKIYNKKYNFAEHIVINTFYASQLLIGLAIFAIFFALFGVSYMDFSFLSLPVTFIYFWYVFKRVYNMPILDSIVFMMLYIVAYAIIFIALGVVSLIIGIFVGLLIR